MSPSARLAVLAFCCCAPAPAGSQETNVHWAYASYFGTGRYRLGGVSDTTVVTLSPSWTWRESERDDAGARRIGVRFRFPVSVGAYEFSSLDTLDELKLSSINAVSFVPGAELELPMSERWTLKALAFAGRGAETGGGVDADIFRLGLRGRRVFEREHSEMQLVSGVERFGFSADDGHSSALNLLSLGLDVARPLSNRTFGESVMVIHWHVAYAHFLDRLGLDLTALSADPSTISSEWELGFAFSKQDERIALGPLKLDRIGLAYRLGSGGDLAGIGIVFRSLFDR